MSTDNVPTRALCELLAVDDPEEGRIILREARAHLASGGIDGLRRFFLRVLMGGTPLDLAPAGPFVVYALGSADWGAVLAFLDAQPAA